MTIDDERCERVRLRLQHFGSPSEGNSDKLRFRCDFSRYPTVAVSESRHFGSPSERHSDKLGFRCDFSRYPTVAVSESRHSRLGLSYFLKTEAVLVLKEPTGRQQDAMSARTTAAAGGWRCQTRPQCRFCLFRSSLRAIQLSYFDFFAANLASVAVFSSFFFLLCCKLSEHCCHFFFAFLLLWSSLK